MSVPLEAPIARTGGMIGGKYRVGRTIAIGGMGVVYEAVNVRTNGKVALKVLSDEAKRDEASRIRFAREARASGRLRSRHVARVLDVDTLDDATPYIVMELLDGQDLSREIKERPPLALDEAAAIVVQVAAGVAEAHAAGIVHRDLKPGNVFLANEGAQRVAKVLDFGISKVPVEGEDASELTCTFSTVGTPAYMSPEQIRSPRAVDASTDVWSLGVLLYRLLTAKLPFTGNASSVAVSICNDVPLPLSTVRDDVPADVSALVDAALDKDKARRPSIAELAEALAPHLGEGPTASIAREALVEIRRLTGATKQEKLAAKPAPIAPPLPPAKVEETIAEPQAMTPLSPRAPKPMLWIAGAFAAVGLALGIFAMNRASVAPSTEAPSATAASATIATSSTMAPATTASVTETPPAPSSSATAAIASASTFPANPGAKPSIVLPTQPPRPKATSNATATAPPLPPRL